MFSMPGPMEMVVIGIIAILLFGKRLPDVARSLGKSLSEFKRGMKGIQDEFNSAMNAPETPVKKPRDDVDDRHEPTAPKFVPPSSAPSPAPAAVKSETST